MIAWRGAVEPPAPAVRKDADPRLSGVAAYASASSSSSSSEEDSDDAAERQRTEQRKRPRQQASLRTQPAAAPSAELGGLPAPDFEAALSSVGGAAERLPEVAPRDAAQEARAREREDERAAGDQALAYKHFRQAKKGATSKQRTADWRAWTGAAPFCAVIYI